MKNNISIQEAERKIGELRELYRMKREEILAEQKEAIRKITVVTGIAVKAAVSEGHRRKIEADLETRQRIQKERELLREQVDDIRLHRVWRPADESVLEHRISSNAYELQSKLTGFVRDEVMNALVNEKANVRFEKQDGQVVYTVTVPVMRMEDYESEGNGEEQE